MFARTRLPVMSMVFAGTVAIAAAQAPGSPQTPKRDTPAPPASTVQPAPTGAISGRVVSADTGRPVPRARVMLSGGQFPGRAALTDTSGAFALTALPDGRFTLTVSKSGYVTLSYGQRRPLQAGTPLQLAVGQQIQGIEFRLPRGSVVTGRVLDDNNDPLPNTTVRVMAYEYAQGNRQLVAAGSSQTDDRGEYRVWGLNPGEYYVSASAPNLNLGPGGPQNPPPGFGGGFAGRGGGRGGPPGAGGGDAAAGVGYAPTYYPGVASVGEARSVTLGLGAEVADISFNVLLVRTSRVTGHVTNPDGTPTTSGNVSLMAEGQAQGGRGGPGGGNYGSRVQGGGQFSIANVPPGRYTLRARGENAKVAEFAALPLLVSGGDTADVIVILAPAASIAGTITTQSTQSAAAPDVAQFRISSPADDFQGIGPNGNARIDRTTGAFILDGLAPGAHLLRAQTPRGWTLKSVLVDGLESIDTPFALRPGQTLTGVSLVFTDKISEINGTVTDSQGSPVTEYTVLAFPDDTTLWRPQSRQIVTARPDQNGAFQIRGLPAGPYYLAVVDPIEQGEWFEPAFLDQHRAGAQRLVLGDGDVKTQDFKIPK